MPPCPEGCRKIHGNKGRKATPAQAAALRAGREKLVRLISLENELYPDPDATNPFISDTVKLYYEKLKRETDPKKRAALGRLIDQMIYQDWKKNSRR